MSALKKLLAVAAAITTWAVIQPGALSAQTSGYGADGFTRLLWKGTDGRISLWKLDQSLNFVTGLNYGPSNGWLPIAITTAFDNNTYVLWRNTDGHITIWLVDTNVRFVIQKAYPGSFGWIAESLSPGTGGNSNFRLLWRNTNGAVAIWDVNADLNVTQTKTYGPIPGLDSAPAAAPLKSSASGTANTTATNASVTLPVSK